MPRTRSQQPQFGVMSGSPCPYSSDWSDEPCGAEADHWSAAVNRYLCREHYTTISQQFVGAAAALAGTCPECGEERRDCVCRDSGDNRED